MRNKVALVCCIGLALLFAGCSKNISSFSLNMSEVEVVVGKSEQLEVLIEPAEAKIPELDWTSSDISVVIVDDSGRLTAHSIGIAVVSVKTKDGKHSAECNVIVKKKEVTGVNINQSKLFLEIGQQGILNAVIMPDDAGIHDVIWSSSDESVADVSDSGIVMAISAGTAIITVQTEDGGFTDNCTVTVAPQPAPSNNEVSIDDLSLGGISLDGGATEVLNKFGQPDSKQVESMENVHNAEFMVYFIKWNYDGIQFTFWTTQHKSEPKPDTSDRLLLIEVDSNIHETIRGVKVGDALSKVIELYGKNEVRPIDKTIWYESNTGFGYVTFTMLNDTVSTIRVGSSLD